MLTPSSPPRRSDRWPRRLTESHTHVLSAGALSPCHAGPAASLLRTAPDSSLSLLGPGTGTGTGQLPEGEQASLRSKCHLCSSFLDSRRILRAGVAELNAASGTETPTPVKSETRF